MRAIRKTTLTLMCAAWILGAIGCGGPKQEEYCDRMQLPCKGREQLAKDFTHWDGYGDVRSVDSGPRLSIDYKDGTGRCCYEVTYDPEGP